jgi:hypothetical protein
MKSALKTRFPPARTEAGNPSFPTVKRFVVGFVGFAGVVREL